MGNKTTLKKTVIGKGKDLVLLNGFGFDFTIFQSIIDSLKYSYRMTLIDLPGFGENNSFEITHCNSIQSILEAILQVVPKQAIWMGWSLGGSLALWATITYPEKVSLLISLSSSPRFIQGQDWEGVSSIFFQRFHKHIHKDYANALSDFMTLLSLPRKNKNLILYLRQFVKNNAVNPNTIQQVLNILKTTDLRKALSKIQCPSLFLMGDEDPLISCKNFDFIQKQNNKITTNVLKGEGHIPFLTNSSLFIEILQDFLENKG